MKNIIPHDHAITQVDRVKRSGFKPVLIWFTGLSGSGKSTLAGELEVYLYNEGVPTYMLDGDNIRSGINKDLDFSEKGRKENIRRISEISKLFLDAGVVILTAFISPFRSDRQVASDLVGEENFFEIFVDCPIAVCEERDVKGLYAKARRGEIKNFTGITSPFEKPLNPTILVNTATSNPDECVRLLINKIVPKLK